MDAVGMDVLADRKNSAKIADAVLAGRVAHAFMARLADAMNGQFAAFQAQVHTLRLDAGQLGIDRQFLGAIENITARAEAGCGPQRLGLDRFCLPFFGCCRYSDPSLWAPLALPESGANLELVHRDDSVFLLEGFPATPAFDDRAALRVDPAPPAPHSLNRSYLVDHLFIQELSG